MKPCRGFTLIELLVSVAIVAIMIRLAVPSYQFIINSSRISSELDGLQTSFQLARSEALRRGLSVTVCSSVDGRSCSGSSNWKTGWLVFVDPNHNAAFDRGDTLLRQQPAWDSPDLLEADNGVGSLRFSSKGMVAGLPADPVTFGVTPPTNAGLQKRCLAVGASGRLAMQPPGTGAC